MRRKGLETLASAEPSCSLDSAGIIPFEDCENTIKSEIESIHYVSSWVANRRLARYVLQTLGVGEKWLFCKENPDTLLYYPRPGFIVFKSLRHIIEGKS
jgi:hypothetical protein